MQFKTKNISPWVLTRIATKKQGQATALRSLRDLLGFVSIRSRELAKLLREIRRLERMVVQGQTSQAIRYGNYLGRSYKMVKASAHSVLRDTTSPGLGSDYRRQPWKLDISKIQKLWKAGERMRVWLDKPDGSLRPLAVPMQKDRIIERSLLTIMEILAAPKQSSASIGFRYNQDIGRGLHEMLGKAIRKYGTDGFNLLDTDFRKYYDSIPHSGLRTILRKLGMKGINWKYLTSSLTASVISSKEMVSRAKGKIEGAMGERCYQPIMGTPQGCVISPLLANLYGNSLDRGLEARKLPFLRYADNLLVAYPKDWGREEVLAILERMKPKGITLHEGKTQSLEGDGTLVTLGSAIARGNGEVRLYIAAGYLGKAARQVKENLSPWGRVEYIGRILDFLRNLGIHSTHQSYTDRRSWSRRVGNSPTYMSENEYMKGGVWREIRIDPTLTGTMKIRAPNLLTVKGWRHGVGIMPINLMEEINKARVKIRGLKSRLNTIMDLPLRKIASAFVGPTYQVYDDNYPLIEVSRIPVMIKKRVGATMFAKELKAKVLLSQGKTEYNWSELDRISKGLKAAKIVKSRRRKSKMPEILQEE